MMIPHPAAHYPQMPWAAGEGAAALQPVFINPQEYQQIMQNRPPSVDSSLDSASKSGSRRGSMKGGANDSYQPKFIPSIMQKQKAMQGSLGRTSKLALAPCQASKSSENQNCPEQIRVYGVYFAASCIVTPVNIIIPEQL